MTIKPLLFAVLLPLAFASPASAQEASPAKNLENQAWNAYAKKDFDGAIRAATDSIALDASQWLPYHFRAWAYYGKGEYKKAAEDHLKTVELGPKTDPFLLFSAALCRSLHGAGPESLEWAGRALGVKAGDANALTQLGYSYFDLGEPDLASAKFAAALAANPKQADAHLGLALASAKRGKAADAAKHLADAKALKPDLDKIDIPMMAFRRFTAKQKKALQALAGPAK